MFLNIILCSLPKYRQRVLQLWVDIAVLPSRNSRQHFGAPEFRAVITSHGVDSGAFVFGSTRRHTVTRPCSSRPFGGRS